MSGAIRTFPASPPPLEPPSYGKDPAATATAVACTLPGGDVSATATTGGGNGSLKNPPTPLTIGGLQPLVAIMSDIALHCPLPGPDRARADALLVPAPGQDGVQMPQPSLGGDDSKCDRHRTVSETATDATCECGLPMSGQTSSRIVDNAIVGGGGSGQIRRRNSGNTLSAAELATVSPPLKRASVTVTGLASPTWDMGGGAGTPGPGLATTLTLSPDVLSASPRSTIPQSGVTPSDGQGSACLDRTVPSVKCDACPACADTCADPGCRPCSRASAAAAARAAQASERPVYTMCQVKRRCTEAECWMVAQKVVYDVTGYVRSGQHPGANRSILRKAGTDVSADHTMHSKAARKLWKTMAIGKLQKCAASDEGGSKTRGKGNKPWSLGRW